MELTLELIEQAIAEIKENTIDHSGYEVAFINSGDWRECKEAVSMVAGVSSASFTGEWVWGMKVIAIPEIPEGTVILYSSPDHYKVLKNMRKIA